MRRQSADRQLTLAAVSAVKWVELPEETRRRAREHVRALLRAAALNNRRIANGREGTAHESR
jgi:hypothetical protein